LVHAEQFDTIEEAIAREKALKAWRRDWNVELIEVGNPEVRSVRRARVIAGDPSLRWGDV